MRCFLTVLLLLLSTSSTFAGRPPATGRGQPPMPPTLTVNGDAEFPAKPDLAIVRMGAEMQADTAQAAQEQVNQVMTKATAAIRELGIAEVDIQTSGLNLYPVYAPPNREQQQRGEQGKVIGYRAGNVLEIRVDDLAKVGPIIDAAIKEGANRMESVNFSLKDDIGPRKKALAAAAKEARGKADALAEAAGVTIEGIEDITEGGMRLYPPQPMRGRGMAMAAEAMTDTPVQPGQVRVHATVSVTYRIAPMAGE